MTFARRIGRGRALAIGAALAVATAAAPQGQAGSRTIIVESGDPFSFVEALEGRNGPKVSLEVALELPDRAPGPVPAVLFIHGAGGPQPHHEDWLALFKSLGVATARADHFSPRGKGSAVGSHIRLTGAAMAVDALNILRALAAEPRIDATRIAIMGASKGGGVALYTAWEPLRRAVAPEARFAAHIALYPTCMHWDAPEMTSAPIRVLVGEADDWTGVAQCRESVAALRAAGADARITTYPDAPHGFDSRVEMREIPNAYNVTGCRFSIDAEGREFASGQALDTAESKRRALRACIQPGVSYGGAPAAREAARADVEAILTAALLPR